MIAAIEEELEEVDAELAPVRARCSMPSAAVDLRRRSDCPLPLARRDRADAGLPARSADHTLAGLDPVVEESAVVEESGEPRLRGKLAKAGSGRLRWALSEAAVHAHRATAPDLEL